MKLFSDWIFIGFPLIPRNVQSHRGLPNRLRITLPSLDKAFFTHLAIAVQWSIYPAVCLHPPAEQGSGIGIDALPFTHLSLEWGPGAPDPAYNPDPGPRAGSRLQMMMMMGMMVMALTVIVCCGHFHVGAGSYCCALLICTLDALELLWICSLPFLL